MTARASGVAAAPRPRRPRVLRDRGRALFAAGGTLLGAGIVLGFADLVRIGALCLILVGIAVLALRWPQGEVEVERHVSDSTLTVGQRSHVELEVVNVGDRRTPTYAGEDALPAGFGGPARFELPAIRPRGRARVRYDVRPTRRGRFRIGPVSLVQTDPLSLGGVRRTTTGRADVVVLPRVHDLTLEVTSTPSAGDGGGESSRYGASLGVVVDAIRGYRPGDDLRRIHWPVTAHRGELMVREDTAPARHRAVVVLDPPAAGVAGAEAALDWAVEALAAVAVLLSGRGHDLVVVTPETAAAGRLETEADAEFAVRSLAVTEPGPAVPSGGLAVRPAVVGAAREAAGEGGLLVAAAFDADPGRAHALLDALPPGAPGLLLVLDTRSFAGAARTAASGGPGGGGDAHGTGGAPRLAAEAAAGGWHAHVVRAGDDVADAWGRLLARGAR